jgi:alanyl-tRNA synthetase
MRVIADHLRGAGFLAVDGIVPSNKEQGYVMRRLLRRAILFAFDLGIEHNFFQEVVPIIADLYHEDYPEVAEKRQEIINTLMREERIFRETLRKGLHEFNRFSKESGQKGLSGDAIFKLHDTYGFPLELTLEEAFKKDIKLAENWRNDFDKLMKDQRSRSQTASKGVFKGGLADHTGETVKLHTATHLMYEALRQVLGDHVVQRGSNVTAERTRFDFSHPEKVTREQLEEVEKIVNEQIDKDLKVEWKEFPTDEAFEMGAKGAFGDKYGEKVKVYIMGAEGDKPFSIEICGGPHVDHTNQLGEGGKRFKITKEEASSAGVRRIKGVLA